MKKQNKLVPSLVAVIILLAIIAGVSIAYNFLGGFYYCRVVEFNKVLGEEQTISINGQGAYVASCNFSGSLVVGAEIKQTINVVATNITSPLFLRAKALVCGFEEKSATMFGYSNWVLAKDGYLYYNQSINAYNKVGVCNTVTLNVQMDIKSSENYIVTFVVEASENNWTYEAV